MTFYATLITLLAGAALLAYAMALGLGGALMIHGSRRSLGEALVGRAAHPIGWAWMVALVASAGSLYLSEVVGFVPCLLCWYQRIVMYPLVVVLGVAMVRGDAGVWRYALPLSVIGALIAAYHVTIQLQPSLDAGMCSAGASCTGRYLGRVRLRFHSGDGRRRVPPGERPHGAGEAAGAGRAPGGRMNAPTRWLCALTVAAATSACSGADADRDRSLEELRTRAEASGYVETSRYQDVMEFLDVVVPLDDRMHLTTFGYTQEGRALPLVVVGAPSASPDAVRATGKVRVYLQGNIHAGEVPGKESLQMLLREIAQGRHDELLDSLVLLVAPIYNADGNERVALTNRPLQHGPLGGMGQRPNAMGLDLNRDHMKLDAPEARALTRMLTAYDPHVGIDLHTTNGTRHAYHLTYSPPLHPDTPESLVSLVRERWLPEVSARMLERTGWHTYDYGNLTTPEPGRRAGLGDVRRPAEIRNELPGVAKPLRHPERGVCLPHPQRQGGGYARLRGGAVAVRPRERGGHRGGGGGSRRGAGGGPGDRPPVPDPAVRGTRGDPHGCGGHRLPSLLGSAHAPTA